MVFVYGTEQHKRKQHQKLADIHANPFTTRRMAFVTIHMHLDGRETRSKWYCIIYFFFPSNWLITCKMQPILSSTSSLLSRPLNFSLYIQFDRNSINFWVLFLSTVLSTDVCTPSLYLCLLTLCGVIRWIKINLVLGMVIGKITDQAIETESIQMGYIRTHREDDSCYSMDKRIEQSRRKYTNAHTHSHIHTHQIICERDTKRMENVLLRIV